MQMEYNITQVQEVATFLWKKNPHVKQWPSAPKSEKDVFNQILKHAKAHGMRNMNGGDDEWVRTVSTGGYTLIVSSDRNNIFDVEVLVDLGVGSEARYVKEYIDEES
jgi:hypothetical protein